MMWPIVQSFGMSNHYLVIEKKIMTNLDFCQYDVYT